MSITIWLRIEGYVPQLPSILLLMFFRPNQRAFTNPRHGGDLPIGLALIQKGQSQSNLLRLELLRSAIFEIWVKPCNCFSCLRALNNGSSFVFGKRKYDRFLDFTSPENQDFAF